uniref:Uncharacterized protein n=1 Tax=Arundo donax TaxID=35708 RepID=A0A0A9CZU5_ARUDO
MPCVEIKLVFPGPGNSDEHHLAVESLSARLTVNPSSQNSSTPPPCAVPSQPS